MVVIEEAHGQVKIHTAVCKLKNVTLPNLSRFMLAFCVHNHKIILYNNYNSNKLMLITYYYNVASKMHYIHSQHRQFRKLFWWSMPPDSPLVHHALQRQRIVGWLVDITYYDYWSSVPPCLLPRSAPANASAQRANGPSFSLAPPSFPSTFGTQHTCTCTRYNYIYTCIILFDL